MASLIQSQTRKIYLLQKKVFNSRFFMFSMLIHVLIVLVFGGKKLFDRYVEPEDFVGEAGSLVASDQQAEQPPQEQPQQPQFNVSTPQVSQPTQSMSAITSTAMSPTAFNMPTVQVPTIAPTISNTTVTAPPPPPSANPGAMPREIAGSIKTFTQGWSAPGGGGAGSSLKSRRFQFTAFLAKYSGGDWDSTVQVRNGKITSGSLPNLLYYMNKVSGDKIKAAPDAVPLDLASQDIFVKKPPFILFTGHSDFVLSEVEVENLRKYIRLGGCVWGDSSLPGLRSAFDIAFRRELRRVMPDKNIDWEKLPANHALFANAYNPEIKSQPSGMNYYQEPVECLKFYGEIAVLYTPNDYGDMWRYALTGDGRFDLRRDEHWNFVAMDRFLWDRRNTYFRNIEDKSVVDTYKFGTNIVVHLLTRWENKTSTVSATAL